MTFDNGFKAACLALAFCFTGTAHAAPSAKDIKLLEKYFEGYVYELEQPIVVYHWSEAAEASYLESVKYSTDKIGPAYVVNRAKTYWQTQNNIENDENMYGRGLYFALDPVATRSYGKDRWFMVQATFPKGFRMLDLSRDGKNAFPQRIQTILTDAHCPLKWEENTGMFDALMQPKNPKVDPECMSLIKRVFQKHFALDGFAYGYNSSMFKECTDPNLAGSDMYSSQRRIRSAAFVVTGSNWVTPERVRIFSPKTIDNRADRIRIQSFFYKTEYDRTIGEVQTADGAIGYSMSKMYNAVPGYRLMNEYTCEKFELGKGCLDLMKFCKEDKDGNVDEKDCVTKNPPPLPTYPVAMTDATFPDNNFSNEKPKTLLWSDLANVSTDANVGSWIEKNFLGCSDKAPYKNLSGK